MSLGFTADGARRPGGCCDSKASMYHGIGEQDIGKKLTVVWRGWCFFCSAKWCWLICSDCTPPRKLTFGTFQIWIFRGCFHVMSSTALFLVVWYPQVLFPAIQTSQNMLRCSLTSLGIWCHVAAGVSVESLFFCSESFKKSPIVHSISWSPW